MMEDTQVLNAESKAAPLQAPEAIDDNAFLNSIQPPQNNKPETNIYNTNTPVVAEKDYASTIASNVNDAYKYNSKVDLSKEPVVTTQSTTKGNITDKTTWTSRHEMDDMFKATEDADYEWNLIAQERAQYTYDKEATQVMADYAKSMQEIKEAGAAAMDAYFAAAYTANQTADKMGWQGGQVTSQAAKTAFLKMSTTANMYSKFELQEYGINSQLAVARMYAEAEMEKLALDIYQDALDNATRQGELTGFYISPEASEIMKQQEVARKVLENKNSTTAEKNRANEIISAGNAYFDKLGFEKEYVDPISGKVTPYPGVKLLATKEYEETIRANKENERLQQQANDIADQARIDANNNAAALRNKMDEQMAVIRNQTAIQELNNAYVQYGTSDATGVGNFVKTESGYQRVTDVEVIDGQIWGTLNGKKTHFLSNGQYLYTSVVLSKDYPKQTSTSKQSTSNTPPKIKNVYGDYSTSSKATYNGKDYIIFQNTYGGYYIITQDAFGKNQKQALLGITPKENSSIVINKKNLGLASK
jgi:hypothetical protein